MVRKKFPNPQSQIQQLLFWMKQQVLFCGIILILSSSSSSSLWMNSNNVAFAFQVSSSFPLSATTTTRTTTTTLPRTTTTNTNDNHHHHSKRHSPLYKSKQSIFSRLHAVSSSQQEQETDASSLLLPPAISIEGLSCTHNGGETYQLDNVSYVLPRGAKVALIGRNGTGKSTFLKILAESCRNNNNVNNNDSTNSPTSSGGTTTVSSITDASNYKYTGTISCPKTLRVAIVEQEPPMPADVTVGDAILGMKSSPKKNNKSKSNTLPVITSKTSVYEIVRQYKHAVQNAEQNPEAFTMLSAAMDDRNGWSVFTKAEEIATKLRVYHLQDELLSNLSGGERKRVALCAALVEEPDVLLLDEPTNFLSLAGVQWLTDLLTSAANPKLTVLMVTHDRAFLEDVCNRILELDRGKLYEHPGSYSSFLQAKQERFEQEDALYHTAKAKYKNELEWMRRQPQARQTKSQARIDAFYKLQKSTKPRPMDPNLNLSGAVAGNSGSNRRLGTKIISMRNVSLKFGDRIMLDDFNYDFCPGDRICLAGANGVGKTTFTKLITGDIEPTSGEIEIGDTVVLGVYDQLGLNFDESIVERQTTVMEFVLEQVQAAIAAGATSGSGNGGSKDSSVEVRRLLKQFEFPSNRWNERVVMLSGGERRRLQLLSVLTTKPNFLILDEPSVDCDMDTLSSLEEFLQENYKGVLLIVSHDRSFADKVTDHLFIFEGKGVVKDFQGSLSEYASCLVELENDKIVQQQQQQQQQNSNDASASSSSATTALLTPEQQKADRAKRNEIRNFIRKAKKEMTTIESSIEKLKVKAEQLQNEMDQSGNQGWTVLADLTDQLNAVNETIDEKEMRWLELGEELELLEEQEQEA